MRHDPRQSALQAALAPDLLRRKHLLTLALYSAVGFGVVALLQFALYDPIAASEVFDRGAARVSGIINVCAGIFALAVWVANRAARRSARWRLPVYRWSVRLGLPAIALIWAVHEHIAGTQSTVVAAVGFGLLVFAGWFFPWRQMVAFGAAAFALHALVVALELGGALSYAPIFVEGEALAPVFLDWRVVFGNSGILFFLFATTVVTLRRFREQVDASRAALLHANADLQREVADRRRAEAALREARTLLEQRVAERTKALQESLESLRSEQRERARAEADRERHRDRLRSLAAERSHDRERERQRVARQLHDGICQLLVFAQIQTSLLAESESGEAARGRFDALLEVLDSAYREARGITTELRPTVLFEVGLEAALRQHIETLGQRVPTPIRFEARGDESIQLPESRRPTIFRAACELLANAVKHSGAAAIDVRLERDAAHVRVSVRDDGRGFDEARIEPSEETGTGFGLLDVREEVRAAGGTVAIRSHIGDGTLAVVTLPLVTPRDSRIPPPPSPPDGLSS